MDVTRATLQAQHVEQLGRVEAAQAQLTQAHTALAAIEASLVQLTQQSVALMTSASSTRQASQTPGVSLLLNPASKSFLDGTHRPEEIVAALQAVGITPRMELTTPEIDARQLARKALDRGDHLIIAAGGDDRGSGDGTHPQLGHVGHSAARHDE
jgi:hypothetical protein